MRSRTGCLTCRARKLKCDEQKPQCSQCRKASRECRPSEGIVFRHQQNASMNRDESGTPGKLNGFYSYKNTFDESSVWLEIPKQVTFINVADPYAEEPEMSMIERDTTPANQAPIAWNGTEPHTQSRLFGVQTHGLEALSAAATGDPYGLQQHQQHQTVPVNPSVHTNVAFTQSELQHSIGSVPSPNQMRISMAPPTSPSLSVTSNNNINFLLNPPASSLSPIDPNLHSSAGPRNSPFHSRSVVSQTRTDVNVETDREVAFLLRHFSESPGQWMDLFDLGSYFASYVPVKAVTDPLLKYSACAYAAKQLGRVKGPKGHASSAFSRRASTNIWPDPERVDWYFLGAEYYDKAIELLMKALKHDGQAPPLNTAEGLEQWQATELCHDAEHGHSYKRRRRSEKSRLSSAHSDEVLAATAILSVYEFLDATGPAWNRHLSGVKSLLDIAETGIMPLEHVSPDGTSLAPARKHGFSKSRRATFWNFARQDYLSAFINQCKCRLDTEDLRLWTEAGLLVDDLGFVRPSDTSPSGYPEGDDVMMEDMISNAMVWLSSKIVNYLAMNSGSSRCTESASTAQWHQLRAEVDVWYNGLPETFRPCARIECSLPPVKPNDSPASLTEIWYSIPMCASAMQHYHMAQVMLLVNQPSEQATSGGPPTLHPSMMEDIRFHCLEVCGISVSQPAAAVRINSVQPLYVSGRYLTDDRERNVVLQLLKGIEHDLGWATQYRVRQLLKQWGWDRKMTT